MKKVLSIILAAVLLFGLSAAAYATTVQGRAVIGANLDQNQINQVYQAFGFPRGYAPELYVTNSEERMYLEGLVDESIIGTRSISCVYVELLPAGTGMDVTTSNITWCTPQMYINALATAGVTDARIIVAAPIPVSGTAGLTGVYKAYEDLTGQKLDNTAKLVSTQELTITGELAQQIGQLDSTSIVSELKKVLEYTGSMTDEEIRAQIEAIAAQYNVSLTETQYSQLISLCRALEGLDSDSLKQRVESVQDTLNKVSEAKTQVVDFMDTVKNVIGSIAGFFETISGLFGGE